MWTGLLPNNLVEMQRQYYILSSSRKSAKKWGVDLVGKILRATHSIWMERNRILHIRTAGGIKCLEIAGLETAVHT